MVVTILLSDNSTITKNEWVELTLEEAIKELKAMSHRITRIKEVATPDTERDMGAYVLEVTYDSMLVGAKLTFFS